MLVRDVMTPQVDVASLGEALVVAARRMRDRNVACLPVLERGRLVGIVTARDLVVRGLAENLDASRVTVRDAMSTVALCCFADQSVDEAHEVMVQNQVKRLPVLTAAGAWSAWCRSATSSATPRGADPAR
jgi:CBS domain-containing protein